MAHDATVDSPQPRPRVLIVDDEDDFRLAIQRQLALRGYEVLEVANGREAIKIVRHENPEVVILDLSMPGMDGVQALREFKKVRPEVQVIMLTGFGSTESARLSGKHDVFRYLQKPCAVDVLIEAIEAGRQERLHAMARHEIPQVQRGSAWQWLVGVSQARPGVILLAAVLFAAIVASPSPRSLLELVSTPKTGQGYELISGYADYRKMKPGQTIADWYGAKAGLKTALTADQAAFRARVMAATLAVAVLFWATTAVPVGITAILVGVLMYFFEVLGPEEVAKAYAKDSVVFIFGVLAVSAGMAKTGLDRRIGLLLLGTSTSLARLVFLFCPALAVTAAFLSEHALVAFLAPIFMLGYAGVIQAARLQQDRHLVVMLMLMLTFVANVGGPGSPAAGGRNAVMVGILSEYGISVSFGQWMKYGLPLVPVLALVTAGYFFLVFRRKIRVPDVNLAQEIRREAEKIGPMTRQEYITAGVLVLLIVLWCTLSSRYGMGGPVILCLVLLNVLGVLRWKDISGIHWDVVALYASASAMGVGLASTGAAVWLANGFINLLPDVLRSGTGLAVSSSLFTGLVTNFMSDGATVAAIGPITVPMAVLSNTPPIMVGLATAFASSFACMFIIGTPNNAIVYSMARDPETGEQLVTSKDFLKHGLAVWALDLLVLWGWAFFGYWPWIGF